MKMKFLMGLIFLYTATLFSQEKTDCIGWANTKWGMTKGDIQSLYTDAKPPEQPTSIQIGNIEVPLGLHIAALKVADLDFEVRFFFDNRDGLSNVCLFHCTPYDSINGFTELEKLLTQKYGKPTIQNERKEKGLLRNVRQWVLSSGNVELAYGVLSGPGNSLFVLSILYSRADEKKIRDL